MRLPHARLVELVALRTLNPKIAKSNPVPRRLFVTSLQCTVASQRFTC